MELHQLRYFVAVAEAGSFREAAVQCHVAQPSLSQQIIKLERTLGHKLFDRLGRSIALTAAGRALLPRANAILTAVREAQRDLVQDLKTGHGPLAVGAIPTVAPFLLPRSVGRFVKAYPNAELSVSEDLTEALIDRLLRAELDVCILSLPIDHDQIETEPILDDPLLVVAARDGDVAHLQELSMEEFQDRPAVLLHEMHCLGQLIRGLCHGMRHRIVCHTTQLTTVQSLVALGLGISLVPRICAASDRSVRCVYRPLRGVPPSRKIAAAWRHGRERSWLAERFLEEVRREAARLAAVDDATIFR